MRTTVEAMTTIYRNPEGRKKFSGQYDDNGVPVLIAQPIIHKPGERFDVSQEELEELIRAECVFVPEPLVTPDEMGAIDQASEIDAEANSPDVWGFTDEERRRVALVNAKII